MRCIKGRIFDVAVDLRDQSDTYGQWTGVELSETNHSALYIPEGFGHGFQTLEDDCEVMYFHSKEYVKLAEAGVSWNDPTLGIPWPLPAEDISARDRSHPSFDAVEPLEILNMKCRHCYSPLSEKFLDLGVAPHLMLTYGNQK